jgi:hypothetical protein
MSERQSAENDVRADVIALVGAHVYDYAPQDTGVPQCRHPEHRAGYSSVCPKAWLRDNLPSVFPPEVTDGPE